MLWLHSGQWPTLIGPAVQIAFWHPSSAALDDVSPNPEVGLY